MDIQNKETNSIITRQEEINQSVQGSFCSFVAETDEQKASLYKAMTSPDRKMSDFINQKINAVDVFVEQVEITDDETGEVAVLPRVVIFDQDGTTYSATSRGIFNALKRLFLVYGMPHWEKPIPLIIKQTTAKNRKFMTLDIGK